MRALPLVLLAVILMGCGTTEKSGGVGDTLTSRTLRATLEKVVPKVPIRHPHDITGLGVPAPGTRFVGARMKLCRSRSGPAVNAYAFTVAAGGATVHGMTPETVYPDDFDVSRDGCEEGWLLFSVAKGATATKLTLTYDDTGSGGGVGQNGGKPAEHARFTWTLPG